ncbi:MAG: DUF2572 family protein [Phycisphaerales bacterium]|nr:DUF2572 family protein [Phycisphaerales bacterium]
MGVSARRRRTRGGIYLLVLGGAMLITVIGVAGLSAARIRRSIAVDEAGLVKSRAQTDSAVELGLRIALSEAGWRASRTSGFWVHNRAVDNGIMCLYAMDAVDGDFTDSALDPVLLTGVGGYGRARFISQAEAFATPVADQSMNYALASAADITIEAGATLSLKRAAVRGGKITVDGAISGDVEAVSVVNPGNVSGTVTSGRDALTLPSAGLYANWASLGTIINSDTLDKAVLAPGYSSFGPANPRGVYIINQNGKNVTVRDSRIQGLLVVQCDTLVIERSNNIAVGRSDLPVIVSLANATKIDMSSSPLSELTNATNYNPAGAPYHGDSDALSLGLYESVIIGVVHATGTLEIKGSTRIRGTVLSKKAVNVQGDVRIDYRDTASFAPPTMYTSATPGIAFSPLSWRRAFGLPANPNPADPADPQARAQGHGVTQ